MAIAAAGGDVKAVLVAAVGGSRADAKSVLGIMGLGAVSGQDVTVRAADPDAREAVSAVIGVLAQATPVGG